MLCWHAFWQDLELCMMQMALRLCAGCNCSHLSVFWIAAGAGHLLYRQAPRKLPCLTVLLLCDALYCRQSALCCARMPPAVEGTVFSMCCLCMSCLPFAHHLRLQGWVHCALVCSFRSSSSSHVAGGVCVPTRVRSRALVGRNVLLRAGAHDSPSAEKMLWHQGVDGGIQ